MIRCILDPGVLAAARLSGRGAAAELIRRWLRGQIDLVASPKLLAELHEVLIREAFRPWLSADEATMYVLRLLRARASLHPDPSHQSGHSRDPGDDYLVVLARVARVDVLVSAKPDLVEMASPWLSVLTPKDLIARLDQLP